MSLPDTRESVDQELPYCYWDICADKYLAGEYSLDEAIAEFRRYSGQEAVAHALEPEAE